MQMLPPALTDLIEAFGLLPGVGPRTAERYAYYLVRHTSNAPDRMAAALSGLAAGIGYCQKTFALVPAGQELSDLYTDPRSSCISTSWFNVSMKIMFRKSS
jgi:recombination protein RecR